MKDSDCIAVNQSLPWGKIGGVGKRGVWPVVSSSKRGFDEAAVVLD